MNRNYPVLIQILLVVTLILFSCNRPVPLYEETDSIDTWLDPIQTNEEYEPFNIKIKNGAFQLTPIAEYTISAMVVSKKFYSTGWESQLAPVDLALVWGDLVDPNYRSYMKYWQSNRWYYYRYKGSCPHENPYIMTHSSNNHILPATDNILSSIKSIKKDDIIVLEGYLVKIKGNHKGRECWWNSSMSRTDKGNGSCEVFYVNRIRINNLVYE